MTHRATKKGSPISGRSTLPIAAKKTNLNDRVAFGGRSANRRSSRAGESHCHSLFNCIVHMSLYSNPNRKSEGRRRTDLTSLRWFTAALVALLLIAERGRAEIALFQETEPQPRGFWTDTRFAQTEVGLEADFTEDANAYGLRLDQPYLIDPKTVLIGEIYGAKGDQGFGILSAGIGIRRLIGESGWFAGANVFYDALQDSDGFSYSQIGFGGEISKGWLTVRANGYLPVGDHEEVRTREKHFTRRRTGSITGSGGALFPSVTTVSFTETSVFRRSAAWAWDAEVEALIPHAPAFFEPRIAVGYYQIHSDHTSGNFAGVKVRGEVRLGAHVVTDLEWRQDSREIGQEWRAGVRFEFLLGPASAHETAAYETRSVSLERSGKNVRAFDNKKVAGRELIPINSTPRGFYDRVRRNPWPQVVTTSSRYRENQETRVTVFNPVSMATPQSPTARVRPDTSTGTN